MRVFLLLSLFASACVYPPAVTPEVEAESAAAMPLPDRMDAAISVIGEGDGAIAFVSLTADRPVWIDEQRPAQLQMSDRWVEVTAVDPPTARRIDGRVITSASYRVRPEMARFLARGGDVTMQLSIGDAWQTVTAERSDMLE